MDFFAPVDWIRTLSDNTLQLLTVLGVLLSVFGFIYLTSELFSHCLLTKFIQIITMILSTSSFWIICVLFFLKFHFFGDAGLAFVLVSALAAGMIGTFHGVFVIPYTGKENSSETRPLLLRVRLKRQIRTLRNGMAHTPLGCVSGFFCLFLYGLLVFVILFFANPEFTISSLGTPDWTVGLFFGLLFGTLAGAIWQGLNYNPSRKGEVQHRGKNELPTNLQKNLVKFLAKLRGAFSLSCWRKYYHLLTDEPEVPTDESKDSRVIIEKGQKPLPEKVLFKPPILHKRDARRGALLWSIVFLPWFLTGLIESLVLILTQNSSSPELQGEEGLALLVLSLLGLLVIALIGGFAAGISKFIYWSVTGIAYKRLFTKLGAIFTLLGFLLTLAVPFASFMQSVSANTILNTGFYTVESVAWSPDSTRIAVTGSSDVSGGVQIWDGVTQKLLITLDGSWTGSVTSVAWSPDGTRIAAGDEAGMQVWDALFPSSRPIRIYSDSDVKSSLVKSVAWSPDSTRLAAGEAGGIVQIWDTSSSSNRPIRA
jgi:WD domain, G-beta repeat